MAIEDKTAHLPIRHLMSTDLVTLSENENMNLASLIMTKARIRHLPVVDDNNRLQGLVTHRDLLRISISEVAGLSEKERQNLLEAIPVREVMRTEITTIGPDTDILQAAKMLISHKYGCLPIVDESGKLEGLVTEADFVQMMVRMMELG